MSELTKNNNNSEDQTVAFQDETEKINQDDPDARFGFSRIISKEGGSQEVSKVGVPRPKLNSADEVRNAAPPTRPKFMFDEAAYFYKMNSSQRGKAVILNYEQFSSSRHDYASTRKGSSVDAANLVRTFAYLGFEASRYDNLTTSQTLALLRETALADHSEYDCLTIVVLSHGDQGPGGETVFYTYDKTLRITDDLVSRFLGSRCESLRGKPKLFFVQACQVSIFFIFSLKNTN